MTYLLTGCYNPVIDLLLELGATPTVENIAHGVLNATAFPQQMTVAMINNLDPSLKQPTITHLLDLTPAKVSFLFVIKLLRQAGWYPPDPKDIDLFVFKAFDVGSKRASMELINLHGHNFDINSTDASGQTLFGYAYRNNSLDLCRFLISKGTDKSMKMMKGNKSPFVTFFHRTCTHKCSMIVPPELIEFTGYVPLHWWDVDSMNQSEILSYVIEAPKVLDFLLHNDNIIMTLDDIHEIFCSILYPRRMYILPENQESLEIIANMLLSGANPNRTMLDSRSHFTWPSNGLKPLHYVAGNLGFRKPDQTLAICKLLLHAGAKVEQDVVYRNRWGGIYKQSEDSELVANYIIASATKTRSLAFLCRVKIIKVMNKIRDYRRMEDRLKSTFLPPVLRKYIVELDQ